MLIIKEDIQILSPLISLTRKAKEVTSEFTHPVMLCPAFL